MAHPCIYSLYLSKRWRSGSFALGCLLGTILGTNYFFKQVKSTKRKSAAVGKMRNIIGCKEAVVLHTHYSARIKNMLQSCYNMSTLSHSNANSYDGASSINILKFFIDAQSEVFNEKDYICRYSYEKNE